uniref:Uncharacterized protein n=1 Tax=Caenorhabditis tropicalis TaxID=1561998 RepID=A0A1I7T309_9PELO
MERELRLKAFMEEYARIVQLFDDIVSMKESMGRLEKYMIIMVCQVLVALMGGAIFMCIRFFQSQRQRGEYELEHRFERGPSTFLHFPASPAPTYSFRDDDEDCSTEYETSEDEDPTITPTNWRHSSPTLSVYTPILTSRRSNSYSSIPTIDRTISEDSMLVIKRL